MPRPHQISRRNFLALSGSALAATLLAACGDEAASPEPTATTSPTSAPSRALSTSPTPAPTPPPPTIPTLEEKIGQMLMVGFRGLTIAATDPVGAAIAAGRLGNVVLFDTDIPSGAGVRNIESPQQLAALTGMLQSLAPNPMLIATDQEGGQVARLDEDHGFPPTVSAEYLGAQDDLELTARHAGAMADTLAAAGINLNLAPVVDLNVDPTNPVIGAAERSFSADPDVVTRHALAFIEAHHERGVLCTLKHFPGHGSSRADSHLGFVDTTSTWTRTELEPFARIIDAGMADAVMTAHIFNANLDPEYPATLSRATIHGLLREELGFEGVVITDDVQMGAIRKYYGFEEAIELTVNAGADIVAIADNTIYAGDAHARAFDAIARAVDAGRINPARIDESYERIVALKQRLPAA